MLTPARRPLGANLLLVRDHNAALVLDLVRGAEGISRIELAARTGLTAQAITKIVSRLLLDRLITEAGRAGATGGKPRTLLRLNPTARYAVGVHLDRADTTVLLTDLSGRTVARRHRTRGMTAGPRRALDTIVAAVHGILAAVPGTDRLLGVGLACPGPLDHTTGVLHRVTGLPQWDGFPLRDKLAGLLGEPTIVDKDTNAAALAECLSTGTAPGSFAYIYHGRGLGAGLVLDGHVYRGRRTNAGEFGHQVVDLDGAACPCGNQGCLEAVCRVALDAGDIAAAARLVGIGAANLVRLLDIDRIVLGGPIVLDQAEQYQRVVVATIRSQLGEPDWQQVTVTLAAAGRDSIATGAAALARAPLFDITRPDR
ncbi:MAG TPA: ROK family transcriptional regulator [Rugosimonospora sp.]|nr:ROK family transcriptional regulator [Rugosimonospora sp.]